MSRLGRSALATERAERAGCRRLAYAPNGVLVGLYDGEAAGLDTEGGRWSTVCEDHDSIVSHDTYRDAMGWVEYPDEWCDRCIESANAERGVDR